MRLMVGLVALFLSIILNSAQAHESRVFEIGGKHYVFSVGSAGEPIFVGDKTAVVIRVVNATFNPETHRAKRQAPVKDFAKNFKVEIQVKEVGATRVFNLKPKRKDPGKYQAVFIPSQAATYTYRFFGTLNGTAVDVSFECSHNDAHARRNTEVREISPGVIQQLQLKGFSCPKARETIQVPQLSH